MLPGKTLRHLFGQNNDDCSEFLRGVLIGSDFEAKTWTDFCNFQKATSNWVTPQHWQQWYARHEEDGSWAVVEKDRWAYFKNGRRTEDWVLI